MLQAQAKAGFTLIEMLVALTLSSVVMMALFSMYSGVVDVASHVKSEEGTAYGQSVFEAILSEDLQSVYTSIEDEFAFKGRSGDFLGIDGEFLSFCTSASLNAVGAQATMKLNRVEYVLEGGREGKALYRKEKNYCGIPGEWEWVKTKILENVTELELEYLSPEDNSYTTQWESVKGSLPKAVSLLIVHSDGREFRLAIDIGARNYVAGGLP